MKVKLVAIDLAKLVFQVCVVAVGGKVVLNKKFTRTQFISWLKDLEPTTIAMEACASAHYWGRKCKSGGHTVLLIPAQHVREDEDTHDSRRARDDGRTVGVPVSLRPGSSAVPPLG